MSRKPSLTEAHLLSFVQLDPWEAAKEEEIGLFRQLISDHGKIEERTKVPVQTFEFQIREVLPHLGDGQLYRTEVGEIHGNIIGQQNFTSTFVISVAT